MHRGAEAHGAVGIPSLAAPKQHPGAALGVPGTGLGLSAPRQVGSQARELLGPEVAAPRGALLPHGPKNLLHHGAPASSWPAAGRFI